MDLRRKNCKKNAKISKQKIAKHKKHKIKFDKRRHSICIFSEFSANEIDLVLCYDGVGGVLYGALVETLLDVDQFLMVLTLLHSLVDMIEDLLRMLMGSRQLIKLTRVC